mmetsp:Transcript_79360/g.242828  ORF Transcript_79360/g.242828 Transcript_79360/m.242828 type:complete len:250 (-) Transcript_79360:280-1029(-)
MTSDSSWLLAVSQSLAPPPTTPPAMSVRAWKSGEAAEPEPPMNSVRPQRGADWSKGGPTCGASGSHSTGASRISFDSLDFHSALLSLRNGFAPTRVLPSPSAPPAPASSDRSTASTESCDMTMPSWLWDTVHSLSACDSPSLWPCNVLPISALAMMYASWSCVIIATFGCSPWKSTHGTSLSSRPLKGFSDSTAFMKVNTLSSVTDSPSNTGGAAAHLLETLPNVSVPTPGSDVMEGSTCLAKANGLET